jgi:dCTP deaminase
VLLRVNETILMRRIALAIDDPRHLAIVPFEPGAVQGASIDMRLGHWFVVARRVKLGELDMESAEHKRLWLSIRREEHFVQKGEHFLIHPGDFVLGATLEFVALPNDAMAFVEGRSGIGRRGLLIATATQVAPGFHGVIVLELANTGTVPLRLRPGMRIAQLVLQRLTGPVDTSDMYEGQFHCQIKP